MATTTATNGNVIRCSSLGAHIVAWSTQVFVYIYFVLELQWSLGRFLPGWTKGVAEA